MMMEFEQRVEEKMTALRAENDRLIEENARLRDEVQRACHDLERRVQERTEDLLAANQQLRDEVVKRQEAEANLRTLYHQLERVNHQKSEFLANMSHEIRTPLNTVLGFTQVLHEQMYGPMNEKQLKSLDFIEQSGQHLLSLINDILDIAKIEAGTLPLEFDDILIEQVCEVSLLLIKQPASKKRLQVSFLCDPQAKVMRTDERRLKQIIVNLLMNAVKFTGDGGAISLNVRGNAEQGHVCFHIIDTGVGIAPENLARLFEPFTQFDSSLSRQQEGAGLGLTLVHHLTTLLGGTVEVTSHVGSGSCFTVSFPWQPSNDALPFVENEHETQDGEENMSATSHCMITVLLAEDNRESSEMFVEYLETMGFVVLWAKNGEEAISLARAQRPDIILMDIQMPVMDGLEAIRHLRKDPELAATPIVALTALAMRGDRERCIEAGANEYVSKPVGLKKLMSVIDNLLQTGKSKEERA